ncbi:MAG: alpha/beta hydrolase [Moritella sp.]|uniref:alpha/beta hydrolase n=1 Tax=Moritella sp. TaxID=78556 RepID=UPI001D7F484B|nr:alpha/beta hydrolase [Moritella sp.]NQZ51605.1 alpha/beta hydrolase [Moritella sp.]
MLFMVTNRKIIGGEYADEEKKNGKFDYLYEYNEKKRGDDKFEKKGKKGFETALLNELVRLKKSGVRTPKVGVYIHGYNNDYQESIDEIVDLDRYINKSDDNAAVIVGFSWPSTGKTAYYLSDREEVRDSIAAFTRFLIDINNLATRNQHDCFSTTFCIAHSMGNYLLRKGMEYLSEELGRPKGRLLFDETIMLAPDISSKDIAMNGKGSYITDFSRRTHVYYSKHDRALKASSIKRFGGNRLGRHGANDYSNIEDNIVVIDAKKYANSESISGYKDRVNDQVSVHSSHRYHESILADIKQVISSVDREQIQGREAYMDNGVPLKNHFKLT